ncbi:MAG: TetR/AcrR family transcriptional regulator [Elusimicrobiales bacterium]|nr:TetR/AcrR family transcriptional regulator [Elusimicrobiales bacterium]
MGRISHNTDKKLLIAGLNLAQKKGIKGFGIRELCKAADVNLGMFHYCFKNREKFNEEVLKYAYSNFITEMKVDISPENKPRENIRKIALAIHRFAKANRRFISALIGDILSGEEKTLKFVLDNFTHHIKLLLSETEREKNMTEKAKQLSIVSIIVMIVFPMAAPHLPLGLLERLGKKKMAASLERKFQSEKEISLRLETVLDAIFGAETKEKAKDKK